LKLERSLAAIDLETTGLDPKVDRVYQFGMYRVDPDGRVKEWETLINPGVPIPTSDPHKVKTEDVANELPFEGVSQMIRKALQGCDICGFNVKFDVEFLFQEFDRIGYTWKPGKIVDSYKIWLLQERRTLEEASKFYLGEILEHSHTALVDARASYKILLAQLKRYPDLPQTVDELHHLLFEKAPEGFLDNERRIAIKEDGYHLAFGKKRGPISKVPKDYLNWMLKSSFSDTVKKAVHDELAKRNIKQFK
jgi:DNA polymerase-3 subunit epsilon